MTSFSLTRKKPLHSGFFFLLFRALASYLLLIFFTTTATPVLAESKSGYQSPKTVEGTILIDTRAATEAHAKGIPFVDVRSARHYNKRHIPGAYHLHIKSDLTEENMDKLFKKDDPIVIYCNGPHCSLSSRASRQAVKWGFTNIHYYREGMRNWRKAGNPVEKGSK